jgi:YceI-like domain
MLRVQTAPWGSLAFSGESIVFKTCGVICAAVLLAACGAPQPRGAATPAAAITSPAAGPGVFRVDASQSELRLLVHRAGPMARLGHNHVIVNDALGGWVKFAGNLATSSFSLSVPVASFVIDDVQARSEEGPDFAEEVSDDAKAGTRHNMLSDALLDGDRYAMITLVSVAVTKTPSMAVNVAGHESMIVVPFTVVTSMGRMEASGIVNLRQSAMGLTPFSVMLGALQVQDELTIKFHLIALAT